MECFHPIQMRDPDHDGRWLSVPCNKCFACQSNRRKEWQFRCKAELQHSICSYTVTYTYDEQHIPRLEPFIIDDPMTCKEPRKFYYHPYRLKDLQDFHKILRHEYSFRFFGVAEYGGKFGRPHFHVIYFFDYPVTKFIFERSVRKWPHGVQITVDVTNDRCIGYTTKYCVKMYGHVGPEPKLLTSRRPGIGFAYLSKSMLTYLHSQDSDFVTYLDGRLRLPRFFRDKVYSDDEKQLNNLYLLSVQYGIDEKMQENGDIDKQRLNQKNAFISKCVQSLKNQKL